MGRSRSNEEKDEAPTPAPSLTDRFEELDRRQVMTKVSVDVSEAFPGDIHVTQPQSEDAFGVLQWDKNGTVDDNVMEAVRDALRAYGYDDPVVALNWDKNCRNYVWKTADEKDFIPCTAEKFRALRPELFNIK